MTYLFDLRNASFSNALVAKKSDIVYEVPIKISADVDVYDEFDTGVIDTTLWDAHGTITEGAYLGINSLRITGPSTPSWDTDGVIMKAPINPVTGTSIITKAFLSDGGSFAIGLQEYAFTVDSVGSPTTWSLKANASQSTDNSTYVYFEAGRVSVVRGGFATGEIIRVPNTAWVVSDAGNVRPIFVTFIFTAFGYEIWVNQPSFWDAPKRIYVNIRSTATQPADGYSLCVNKRYSDDTLAIFGIGEGFRSDGVMSANVLTSYETTKLYARTLSFDYESGGMVGLSGDIRIQFPGVSPKWMSIQEVRDSTLELSGSLVYPVNFKLVGDVSLNHPITMSDVEPLTS